MAQVQKKTATMSLTISSCSRETYSSSSSSSSATVVQQRHSTLVQPLCISPQRTQSPSQYSGSGVAPTFVKSLHDVCTVKGQLVVLECRIRGTPPLQVTWYRENEQIVDSADFRILRKKASSTSVPEELCTLVITEAYPEDSGIFKCIASNQFGTVSCSALLEVYTDIDEVLGDDDISASASASGGSTEPGQDDFPSLLQDAAGIPPPEWPDSPEEETSPTLEDSPKLAPTSEKEEKPENAAIESNFSSERQKSPEAPRTPPLKEIKNSVPKPFTLASKLSNLTQPSSSSSMSVADLPTFSPSLYPPSAFNYERPRHFIQSQPHFKAPSYDSVQSNGNSKPSSTSSNLSSPLSTPASSVSPSQPVPPRAPMRSSVTLIPRVPSAQSNDKRSSPAAFLCSVLPSQPSSQAKCISVPLPRSPSPRCSPTPPSPLPKPSEPAVLPALLPTIQPANHAPPSPTPPQMSPRSPKTPVPPPQTSFVSMPVNYKGAPNTLPKPILKKTVSRPVSRSTDEEIQGSKDALIQDLEKKLRSKEARRRSSQKLSYEERMARRLLGPDNAASVFDLESSSDSQPEQPDSPEGRHTGGICHYLCISKHLSGGDSSEASTIQEKCYAPRFLQVPEDLTVEEGRFCRIDFKVGGLPTPDVSWYLDGKAIRPDDYHKMLVSEKGVHSFIIEIVTVHHAGVYECVAKNRAGESRFSLRLDVIAQEVLRPPTFVVKMQNCRVLEGDTVRLECKVAASPPPQLYWKKDKEMLRIDPTRMSLTQDSSGRQCLLIERVVKSDAGWYTVSAINEAGMSTCNARLDVGTRLNKTTPAAKPLKMLPIINQFSALGSDSSPRHTAPLYESEEL
ncbi:myotilin [Chanos chanos]|uniref:Myotilin n=1 Tax=Chanos chanos TaxID=29144 RepID=A0A6J2UQ67_CHACN|nr:myotilin [Chanos chanos]